MRFPSTTTIAGGWGDAEARREFGMRLELDLPDGEGVVVAAALQYLGKEPLRTPRTAGRRGVNEGESRPSFGVRGDAC